MNYLLGMISGFLLAIIATVVVIESCGCGCTPPAPMISGVFL